MILLNVSFGIFALMPLGWLFMAFVIILEAVVLTRLLTPQWFSGSIYRVAAWTNMISGILGFITTLVLNGGWFTVIWFPWVSNNEIDLSVEDAMQFLMIFYAIAFALSVGVELCANLIFLAKTYPRPKIVKATIIANVLSYAAGTVVLYSYSFR